MNPDSVSRRRSLRTSHPARQDRSRRTRDALIAAGWDLLAQRPWDEIGVGDIVAAAGCSVGSFYNRFPDKRAFFDVLAAQWVVRTREARAELATRLDPRGDFLAEIVLHTYRRLLAHQHFWRAALARGAADPRFWIPFRDAGLAVIELALRLRREALGRRLTAAEIRHLRFAFQMSNGLINNSLVNRPGPIQPGTREFATELVRGVKAVAGFT